MPVEGLAVLYRMGFGNFSMDGRKGNLFWGVVVGEGGKAIYLSPGGTSALQKRSAMKSSHPSLVRVTAQGQVGGGLGQR